MRDDDLCEGCFEVWLSSMEWQRAARQSADRVEAAAERALVDFCNRVRAERQNVVQR